MFKQIATPLLFAFVILSMSSCLKKYHCICNYDNKYFTMEETDHEILGTKKSAEDDCKEEETANKNTYGEKSNCDLK